MIAVGVIGIAAFCFAMARAASHGDKLPGPGSPANVPDEWKTFTKQRFEQVN